MIEESQKETFWQRVGLKKVDREIPLYALGKDKLKETRENLQKVFQEASSEQRKILTRKLEILKRHKKAIDLSDTIEAKKVLLS